MTIYKYRKYWSFGKIHYNMECLWQERQSHELWDLGIYFYYSGKDIRYKMINFVAKKYGNSATK